MLDTKALTRTQSFALIAIIVVAALGLALIYNSLNNSQSSDNIKIGFLGDIDNVGGKAAWQGAVLAAEEVNDNGGVLGKQIIIVEEDDDSETQPVDVAFATNALTKLISVDKVDFIFSSNQVFPKIYQES
ncbi:MAG: ABC transporter substrate-binding protein [Candidatus Bathyarchaeota archaeon]